MILNPLDVPKKRPLFLLEKKTYMSNMFQKTKLC